MKPYWRGLVIPHSAISFKARRCLKRSVPISFRTAPSRRTNSSSPNPARAFSLGIGGTCFLAGRGSASTLQRSNGLQANTLRCAGTNPYRGHCRKNRTHAHRAFPLKKYPRNGLSQILPCTAGLLSFSACVTEDWLFPFSTDSPTCCRLCLPETVTDNPSVTPLSFFFV